MIIRVQNRTDKTPAEKKYGYYGEPDDFIAVFVAILDLLLTYRGAKAHTLALTKVHSTCSLCEMTSVLLCSEYTIGNDILVFTLREMNMLFAERSSLQARGQVV